METRKLGNTDLDLSVVGFGAWAIGGSWYFGWGEQEDRDSIDAIHAALDGGINWIDTAHVYGFGRSEEVVGRAVRGRRDQTIIATKCGLLKGESAQEPPVNRLKADSVRKECEGSLKRLNTDHIDLYQIHWPNPEEDIEEAWEELNKLKDEGKIRWAGVSNFNVEQMERCHRNHPISSLQPPYSLVNRGIEDRILPWCREHNVGVVVYSPMQSGLLTGKVTKEWVESLDDDDFRKWNHDDFREPKLTVNMQFVDKLRPVAEKHGVQVAQVAVAWTIQREGVTSAIVGARNRDQAEKNVRSGNLKLDEEDLRKISQALEERDEALRAVGSAT